MKALLLAVYAALATLTSAASVPVSMKMLPATNVSNNVIFAPPSDYLDPQVLYARTVELANGDILATWENYSPEVCRTLLMSCSSRCGSQRR